MYFSQHSYMKTAHEVLIFTTLCDRSFVSLVKILQYVCDKAYDCFLGSYARARVSINIVPIRVRYICEEFIEHPGTFAESILVPPKFQ